MLAKAVKGSASTEASDPQVQDEIGLAGFVAGSSSHVLLLPVMLPGGTYAEDGETRLRARRAVVMALSAEGFVPEQSDRLRYLEPEKAMPAVPYEVFHFDPTVVERSKVSFTDVALVWINESLVRQLGARACGRPNVLEGLGRVLGCFQEKIRSSTGFAGDAILRTRIVGPSNTTMLSEIVQSGPELSDKIRPVFAGGELDSPWATIPSRMVPGFTEGPLFSGPSGSRESSKFEIHRTILTDDTVVDALLEELALRRALPIRCDSRMVLVYEWDTEYGRAVRELFRQAIETDMHGGTPPRPWSSTCECCSEAYEAGGPPLAACPHLKTIGYMRGLDGRQPGGRKPVDGKGDAKGTVDPDDGTRPEQPFGTSQLDYARRLAERLTRDEDSSLEGRKVVSIGIIGSDLYDKLLLLRALRPEFPQAIFFTTDLDARLLAPEEQAYVRNLIVATSRGLTPRKDVQSVLPSFRDSYQTNVYATCRMILREEHFQRDHAQVFEIGKSTATMLGRGRPARTPEPTVEHVSYLGGLREGVWVVLILAAIGGAYGQQAIVRAWWRRIGRWARWGVGATLVIAGIFAACVVYGSHLPDGEPFAWWEGISAWPTEILRAVTIVLAILLFFTAEASLGKNANRIRSSYRFEPPSEKEESPAESGKPTGVIRRSVALLVAWTPRPSRISERHDSAAKAWDAYEQNEQIAGRALRVLWFLLLLLAIGCAAYLLFGWPTRPVRGRFCSNLDIALEATAFLSIAALTLTVLDRCIAMQLLVRSLTRTETRWDYKNLKRYSSEVPDGCEDAGHWLDIELLARRTEAVERTLYGPFVLVVLLGISRDSNFDNWGWPVPFIVIETGLLLSAIISVTLLREAAERARRVALVRLDGSAEAARGGGESSNEKVDLLGRLADRVRRERRGAFSPFLDNPVLRALLIPLTGFGSWSVIQSFLQ